ncbi:MAG: glycoside hydrolase family 38 C-terminal domain-containing protein [Anaerolineae bacterium]|jgi:alpha-mannosidase
MYTLHVVSHTHWDREWYRTFQQFRFRLIQLVEALLDILESDPSYRYFMLDGQAVILEDVLDVRPDLEKALCRQIREGRLLIGPWFVLPDEFLVSPEALVRNLLLGDRICRAWGAKMDVGYIPDPFGHISQLPQLLTGFGIETAIFARGAGEAPVEFRWAAPDGTEVLVCYLRDHYDNAAHLPADEDGFVQAVAEARDSLAPHNATCHLLLMQGTDHLGPRADLPQLIAAADAKLPDRVIHSSLPAYVAAVRAELGDDGLAHLPLHSGEMRDPRRAHLLPGVLSTRISIKQRNHTCQMLLERWAEPFSALASHSPDRQPEGRKLKPFVDRAWQYLLGNHPHDSICGCSVDQVHREMETRFDWCQQLAEEVTHTALEVLAAEVETGADGLPALVVFNPSSVARTDRILARVTPPVDPKGVVLVGPDNKPIPFRIVRHRFGSEMEMAFDRRTMRLMLAEAEASGGVIWGEWTVRGLQVWADGEVVRVAVTVTRGGVSFGTILPGESVARLQALLEDEAVNEYRVRIREDEALEIAFVGRDIPPLGYATYRFLPSEMRGSQPPSGNPATSNPRPETDRTGPAIENEFIRVEVDPSTGLLTILDKETDLTLKGCHRFVDGGDRGDEYNYCCPEKDKLIKAPAEPPVVRSEAYETGQSMLIHMVYRLPEGLTADDRSTRSRKTVDLPIAVRVTLTSGVRRVDFETVVENHARDHRLRVHFPLPLAVETASVEDHWNVVVWPLEVPTETEGWIEQPVPTRPQRGWVSVSNGEVGVTLANRGLPEVEVLRAEEGTEIALTLLRCVGWLSRDDFACREGHAGPQVEVPEAQCPGRHTFRYALVPHVGDWRTALAWAESFQTDLRAVSTGPHLGRLPTRLSFVRVEPSSLQVSAVKLPERGKGLVLRLWNAEDRSVEGTVHLWRPFARAVRLDLSEREMEELGRDADAVMLRLRGREVATLGFTFSNPRS